MYNEEQSRLTTPVLLFAFIGVGFVSWPVAIAVMFFISVIAMLADAGPCWLHNLGFCLLLIGSFVTAPVLTTLAVALVVFISWNLAGMD